uniref:Muscarinic acetylcholine receptor n=1 Tax=Callorhinchus milii TaxID=7868 RepID=A0A4W3JFE4_CALMI
MSNSSQSNASLGNLTGTFLTGGGGPYQAMEVVFIAVVAGSLSLVTIIGNILVMVSIKTNRHLQTINNYFLFSLACADLIIGVFSMNLYTVYIVIGYWPLGPVVCDLWLALDYVVSNASVMNLLIISFDRYFCVTKPLSYPIRRTIKMAGIMIAVAWVLSFVLWAPAILFWQFIVGGRTVRAGECYVQFFSNPTVTFGTAIAAFYLPVAIMTGLYVHISRASRSRVYKGRKEPMALAGPAQGEQANCTSNERAMQNGKGDVSCEQQEEKEASNSSNSLSVLPSNPPEGRCKSGPSPNRMASSRLSCIKMITKPPKDSYSPSTTAVAGNHTAAVEILSSQCESRAAHQVIQLTKVPTKKRGCATRERKVTRTILAILLAFIVTWTPYNVMVLINTFCSSCVPNTAWTIGYWLCYINSTINPACYALCNTTFKKTFRHLLLCQGARREG